MGLAFIICGILVGVWALWVAWEVTKSGGVPPYQDSLPPKERTTEYSDTWPFPQDRP